MLAAGSVRRIGRRLLGAARRESPARSTSDASIVGEKQLRATREAEAALRRRIVGALPGGAPTGGAHVTIIVVNRDGSAGLRKLLPPLAQTAYRDADLVVVDPSSTASARGAMRSARLPFPAQIDVGAPGVGARAALNRVVEAATGELVLLLDGRCVPLEASWLGYLVDSLGSTGSVACGARLIVPARSGPSTGPESELADLELAHAGIGFRWDHGMPLPRNISGGDPCDPAHVKVREVVAATAACLLVRRAAFLEAGGFGEGPDDALEDVDLALRWREAGMHVVVDGRAVLWYDEPTGFSSGDERATKARQRDDARRFHGRWGPSLFRMVMLDRLTDTPALCRDTPRIVLLGNGAATAGAAALGQGFRSLAWHVTEEAGPAGPASGLPDEGDLAVILDPDVDPRRLQRHVITIAVVQPGDAERWASAPWVDQVDVLLSPEPAVASFITGATSKRCVAIGAVTAELIRTELRRWIAARRVGILVQAKDWDEAPISGDFHFARALQRQLERREIPTSVYLRQSWADPCSTRDDDVVHLWGRYPMGPRSGQRSVLWILYHPELVTDELVTEYDLVLAASDPFAAELAARARRPVHSVHQATDPERFVPGLPGPHHDLLFVGNSRGIRRRILHDLTPTRHELAVYGRGWDPELLDPAHLRGDGVANEALAGYYASASIVLNDHWPEAAAAGFINNRLYDALAAGAFVISDEVDGIAAEFDGGVVTYRGAAALLRLVDRYLTDPAARAERARRGRAAVLARHTFSHRVDELLRLVDELPSAGQGR